MPIIIAGHAGAATGAMGVALAQSVMFDEGMQTIRLRNAIAVRLAQFHQIRVVVDDDNERLAILCRRINRIALSDPQLFCVDIHFNAHSSVSAHGTEVIVADDASLFEVDLAVRLLNATARILETNRRGVRTESQTPRGHLAMLHLHCPSVILEVCFCTNPSDVELYLSRFDTLAIALADAIAKTVVQRIG